MIRKYVGPFFNGWPRWVELHATEIYQLTEGTMQS